MRALQKTAAAVLLGSLATAGYGIWATYQPPPPELARQEPTGQPSVTDSALDIDQHTLRRAQRLASLALAVSILGHSAQPRAASA